MVPKAGIAIVGALGAGTAIYTSYEYVFKSEEKKRKVTIGETLKGFLLSTESSDKWTARKNVLSNAVINSLVEELQVLKNGITENQIKSWCSTAATKVYSEVSSLYLENVRSYCTFYIEDKLPEGYLKQDSGDWSKAGDRLKQIASDDKLSSKMKIIKSQLSGKGGSGVDSDALKNWCIGVYKKPYFGENSQEFKDAKAYCSKITESTVSEPQVTVQKDSRSSA